MYIVVIAWIYVALMMSAAEVVHPNGGVLSATITFVLYGLLPVALVVYLMGSPARRKAIKAREAAEATSNPPDAGSKPAADAVAPVREKP
jgi:hypothetical protein